MVVSREVELPYYRGVGRQRGRGFGALAQVIVRTAIPFLRKYIVPAAKRICADMLEFAVPEIADVVSGKKNLKSAAKNVGRQTLKKQLGSGARKRSAAVSFHPNLVNEAVGHAKSFLVTLLFDFDFAKLSVPTFCSCVWLSWR